MGVYLLGRALRLHTYSLRVPADLSGCRRHRLMFSLTSGCNIGPYRGASFSGGLVGSLAVRSVGLPEVKPDGSVLGRARFVFRELLGEVPQLFLQRLQLGGSLVVLAVLLLFVPSAERPAEFAPPGLEVVTPLRVLGSELRNGGALQPEVSHQEIGTAVPVPVRDADFAAQPGAVRRLVGRHGIPQALRGRQEGNAGRVPGFLPRADVPVQPHRTVARSHEQVGLAVLVPVRHEGSGVAPGYLDRRPSRLDRTALLWIERGLARGPFVRD